MSAALNVLLVEDDEIDALAFRRALARSGRGWRIEHARDAQAALAFLPRMGADGGAWLAVLDLNLPGMDGLELLRRLRQAAPSLPALVLSSSRDARDAHGAYALHAAGYFVKPADPNGLDAVVSALAAYWERAVLPTY